MSDNTKIEWTDATVNAVNGCSVVSPGCTNCYAMKLAGTRLKHTGSRSGLTIATKAGPVWNGVTKLHEPALLQPLRWRRRRRIFWNAHGDLFHDSVPDEWIDRCFAVMALTPQHIHQVLTKRPERMQRYVSLLCNRDDIIREVARKVGATLAACRDAAIAVRGGALPNVWLGTSVEDQTRADERIPHLLATPAVVRFLSCEPLLGPVGLDTIRLRRDGQAPTTLSQRLGDYVQPLRGNFTDSPRINWVIVGGESGPGARPMHPDWARSLRDQCAAAGVPFFFKQWGNWADMATAGIVQDGPVHDRWGNVPNWMRRRSMFGDGMVRLLNARSWTDHSTSLMYEVGKSAAGRLLDRVEHSEMPA